MFRLNMVNKIKFIVGISGEAMLLVVFKRLFSTFQCALGGRNSLNMRAMHAGKTI
ncbi:hypothetical protein [Yoonia sp. 1_MG-2023]|uniref:hypothetical protein n=1 Tax=Yoonia sp. 1_MG-2023 TaxID=3062659 RepID=UPI0026E331DC|nr:hypothetical protein [Yoonia sp. 1_MG-2023]